MRIPLSDEYDPYDDDLNVFGCAVAELEFNRDVENRVNPSAIPHNWLGSGGYADMAADSSWGFLKPEVEAEMIQQWQDMKRRGIV
jgi:hypothetical protein